jgi:hypothetical protein
VDTTPGTTSDTTWERRHALSLAVELHRDDFSNFSDPDQALTETATAIYDWLTGPVRLYLHIGPVTDQASGQPTGQTYGGSPMQLRETDQVDLTVTVTSTKGTSIPDRPEDPTDDLTWTVADESVARLSISPDTRTCTVVAGTVGSTVVTVGLRELSATLAVDVIPGDAAVLTIGEGSPVPQS